jgi:biotin operon repressor
MPRYRRTKEGVPSLVGRLLLLVAGGGKETAATLAEKLGVSPRQVNRYVLGLREAGWQIERRGVPTRGDYWFELVAPHVVWPAEKKRQGQGSE